MAQDKCCYKYEKKGKFCGDCPIEKKSGKKKKKGKRGKDKKRK